MATQGGIVFQEKVSRLLRGQNGKPVLKPNRALVLKDAVANRKPKKGEASCITEMSVLMACWKQNNFVDALCSNEINSFYTCVEKAQGCKPSAFSVSFMMSSPDMVTSQADAKNKAGQSNIQGGRLPPKQATALLKRYPNLCKEI